MNKLIAVMAFAGLTLPVYAIDFGGLRDQLKGATNAAGSAPVASPTRSGVDSLTSAEINGGLREALTKGAESAVAQLGKENGFWGDAKLRIPLPDNLQKASKLMKSFGMGNQVEALELGMNRAAEAAVPQAKTMLVNAVRDMTLEDAKGILTGGETAATDFFRRKTEAVLSSRLLPIVKGTTDKVGLAQTYNTYAGTAARFGAIKADQASIENYVTKQSLDRLYKVIGEQEKAFRANPAQSGSKLISKVFGSLFAK